METTSTNSLQTVQLIPIVTYLNLLSDFLFLENYLTEYNQTKQIPIVNALYEYLEDHHNNKSMVLKLFRNLLQGSDLYGEQDEENPDVSFINAMFDHIISSLIFDKYGNIYGFLVDVFRKAENLQIDYVMKIIKDNLKNASFENEYGRRSSLSPLSVNRIYNEIILPLFPQTTANISLISLDYIYAQAGLMFLRPGMLNTTYYDDDKCLPAKVIKDDDLFDQYLVTGHIIDTLIHSEEKNSRMMKAFALPALTYYVFTSRHLLIKEIVSHVVFEPQYLKTAYKSLFNYTGSAFNTTQAQLNEDFNYKMHQNLGKLYSPASLARKYLSLCTNFNDALQIKIIEYYLENPSGVVCRNSGISIDLPNINAYYENAINYFIDVYKANYLLLIKEAFEKSAMRKIRFRTLVIKLLHPYDKVEWGNFFELRQVPYDVLELEYAYDETKDYYVLAYENYNVRIFKITNNSTFFQEKFGVPFSNFLNESICSILKSSEEKLDDFFENLINYKGKRLQYYLRFLGKSSENNEPWKSKWWMEFGLSLAPHYNCLSYSYDKNYTKPECRMDTISFLNVFPEDVTSKITNEKTKYILSSSGTTLKRVLLKEKIRKTIYENTTVGQKYELSLINESIEIFEDICLHIEEPAFGLSFITDSEIDILKYLFYSLPKVIHFDLTSVNSILDHISILKSNYESTVTFIGETYVPLFVKDNTKCNAAYGYKYIYLPTNEIAELRTGYEFKNKMFVSPVQDSPHNVKVYNKINNRTFQKETDYFIYDIDHQLRNKNNKVSFYGISIHFDTYNKCEIDVYLERAIPLIDCPRHERKVKQDHYVDTAVNLVKNKIKLSIKEIRDTFKKYLVLDDNATLTNFAEQWAKSENLTVPSWADGCKINNPDLLGKLRYDFSLDINMISNFDGIFRINYIYSFRERLKIEEGASIDSIISDYNVQKANSYATFEDYYAIRNFATTGHTRITGDTQEAKLMKLALYKLAIRQSDDPQEEFELKLFRVECKRIDIIEKMSSKNHLTLKRFTSAFTTAYSATRFSSYPEAGFRNVLYEIIFSGPYVRAKVEQVYENKEKMVILLPGTDFYIRNKTDVQIGGLGSVLKIELKYKHNSMEKYISYKNIMDEIERIVF